MLYDEINDLIERYPDTYTFLTIGNVDEVENKLIDRGRWAVINRVVFKAVIALFGGAAGLDIP